MRLIKALLRRGACVTTPDYQNSDVLALSLEYECIECEPILREAHVRERQRLVRNQQQQQQHQQQQQQQHAAGTRDKTLTASSPDLPPLPTAMAPAADDERSAKSGLRKRLGTFFGRERSKNSTRPTPTSPPALDEAEQPDAAADARRTAS